MNTYKSCRYNGKRMRKHRAILYAIVSTTSMDDGEIKEYMAKMVVHHINGDKSDNRRCNLRFMTKSAHHRLHCKKQIRDKKGRFK